jgi:hypothetical protein
VSRLAQSSTRAVDKGPRRWALGHRGRSALELRTGAPMSVNGGESQTRQVRAWISHFSERKCADYRPEWSGTGLITKRQEFRSSPWRQCREGARREAGALPALNLDGAT